ncbi:MAG: DUF5317 family protein [Kouleothrix sp.]|nr:DUF5317 family protein [Kouleothrix sp.]
MALLAISLIGAICSAGLAFWRRPETPRYWPLLALVALPQLGMALGARLPGMIAASAAAAIVWCLANWPVRGALVAALGIGLNLLAIANHGGSMPIRADVLASIGQLFAPGTLLANSKDVVVHASPVWLLSDWIVLPIGAASIVASPGDLLIVAGIAYWLLFSHQSKKDQPNADTVDQTDLGRAAHAAATGAK